MGFMLVTMLGVATAQAPEYKDPVRVCAAQLAEALDKALKPKEAQVVDVDGRRVTLDLPERSGVARGMEFIIVTEEEIKGKAIPRRRPTGIIKIIEVYPDSCVGEIIKEEEGRKIEVGNRAYQITKPLVVGVADFLGTDDQQYELGLDLANLLSGELQKWPRFQKIVERKRLNDAISELKLHVGGLVGENLKKLGKLVGADALILGTLSVLETEVTVTAKVLEVETALCIATVTGAVAKTTEVAKKLRVPMDKKPGDGEPDKEQVTYLRDLEPIDAYRLNIRPGEAVMDAEPYRRSLLIGVRANAIGYCVFNIGKKYKRFEAWVGFDDNAKEGLSARFIIIGDKKILFDGKLNVGDEPRHVSVDVTDIVRLSFQIQTGWNDFLTEPPNMLVLGDAKLIAVEEKK